MGKQLPEITQQLIYVSDMLQQPHIWFFGIGSVVIGLSIAWFFKKNLRAYRDHYALRMPLVKTLVIDSALLYWFHALAMLTRNKVPLVSALHIAYPLISNQAIKELMQSVERDVSSGYNVCFAMTNIKEQLITPDVLALMQVGQESGALDQMLNKAAIIYRSRVERQLWFFSVILQPLLLVLMAVLVGFLVFALYMPIFNMAQIG